MRVGARERGAVTRAALFVTLVAAQLLPIAPIAHAAVVDPLSQVKPTTPASAC